jgi:hypothetical protein
MQETEPLLAKRPRLAKQGLPQKQQQSNTLIETQSAHRTFTDSKSDGEKQLIIITDQMFVEYVRKKYSESSCTSILRLYSTNPDLAIRAFFRK